MAINVIWSPEAINSSDEIIDYLLHEWSDREVEHFIAHVERVIVRFLECEARSQ